MKKNGLIEKKKWKEPKIENQTPWQEIYRTNVGQLADGGCLELATAYKRIAKHLPEIIINQFKMHKNENNKKTILITGASQGIGETSAIILNEGYNVGLIARNKKKLE